MMVKDEEKNLAKCLKSLEALGLLEDELIVVDTGSKDKTVSVAKKFGAKVIIPDDLDSLFVTTEFGKALNFGKARNETIKPATGDWLLLMDADEILEGKSDKLRKYLETVPDKVEGIALEFVDMRKGGKMDHMRFPQPRIFRKGCIKFERIVHNYPRFKAPALYFEDLSVKHFGYDLTKVQKKAKRDRTLGLLKKQLAMEPTSYWTYFYMANCIGEYDGEIDRSIEYCIKYIKNKDETIKQGLNFNPGIYYTLVQSCMQKGDVELCDKWLSESIRQLPDDLDISMAVLDFGVWQKKPNIIIKGATQFCNVYDEMIKNPLFCGSRFTFNFNARAMMKALFHVTIMRMNEAHLNLRRMMKSLPDFDKKTREIIETDIVKEVKKIGAKYIDTDKI
jgi:glycosyltransferase involved in cell wall biosynthesis